MFCFSRNGPGSTIAVDASGKNTSANLRTSSRPFTGGPAPVCAEVFQWGLSQALGRKRLALNSSSIWTGIAPNAGKD